MVVLTDFGQFQCLVFWRNFQVLLLLLLCVGLDFPWTTFRTSPPLDPPSGGPPTVSLFLCLFGCLLVEFWWCFETLKCAHLGSQLSCETPAAPPDRATGARTRQPENSKRAHFRHLRFKTPPKFHEKTPRETQKQRNGGGKGKKKRQILGPPTLRGPTLLGLVPPPIGAPPFGAPMGETLKH